MDEENKNDSKQLNDQSVDDKFVNSNPHTVFADQMVKCVKTNNLHDSESNDNNEIHSMRVILPVFIENEQKYAQVERKRKIQSSPAKAMRSFSQDSTQLEHQLNVSLMTNKYHYHTESHMYCVIT